jgi:hypothetical protein
LPSSVSRNASDLGITVTLTFQSSANSAASHAIVGVAIKLIVTHGNNPTYFSNQISLALPSVFVIDEFGFTPKFLGQPVGVAPDAARFTAFFANNSGAKLPAVDAFLAIATDGETLVSAPLPQ